MKTNVSKGADYFAPTLSAIDIKAEGILCASGEWYEKGGQGDFGYGTETDDTWA